MDIDRKEAPIVSVLMTAYNREKYIAEAIESVIASTYTDWELIIVDDCSKDRTLEIAKSYENKDSRIKVYQNEKNLGDYSNRNKAASYARGKYLKYLDADDIIYSHGLEVMVKSMEKFPESGFGTQINTREYIVPYPFQLNPYEAYKKHFLEGGLLFSGPTGVIIRCDIFEKVGGFTGRKHIGDIELWFILAALSPVVCFQPALIWWRQHPGQDTAIEKRNSSSSRMIISRFELNLQILNSQCNPLDNKEREIAILNQKKVFARKILANLFRDWNLAYCLFNSKMFRWYDLIKAFHVNI